MVPLGVDCSRDVDTMVQSSLWDPPKFLKKIVSLKIFSHAEHDQHDR